MKKAGREEGLEREEIAFLLDLEDPAEMHLLFRSARRMRRRYSGDRLFLYGFLYLSTYCRNDCLFCYYRRSNSDSLRYRKSRSEILSAAESLTGSGVHLIDLTAGEDLDYHGNDGQGADRLTDMVSAVGRVSGLPVMVSPGVIPDAAFAGLVRAGAVWYACYQETFNRRLFSNLRPDQSFDERLHKKRTATGSGLLLEEGVLCGVGESIDDLADAVIEMGALGASQMRAMTFVPKAGTPMAARPEPDARSELRMTAVLRLLYPCALVPASLDVAGLAGLEARLDAGANVVTSIVPPGMGLAGVAHPTRDIASARRTAAAISGLLDRKELQPAAQGDYLNWLDRERRRRSSERAGVGNSACALP